MPRFCTALLDERYAGRYTCPTRALPGKSFCFGHDPERDLVLPCSYVTAEGEHCRSTTLRGQDYCFAHSPRNIHRRRPAVRRPPQDLQPADPAPSAEPIFSNMPHTAERNF